jgi:tetratricopeptide (TPR) repeat protein
VLLVEDLHWADDGSLDLLQHLVVARGRVAAGAGDDGRPALLARRPDWGTPRPVPLSPLAAAQSDALAQALLQRLDAVPQKLTELIVGRAEGNPYYMEELLRRLVDDGVIVVGEPHWTVQTGPAGHRAPAQHAGRPAAGAAGRLAGRRAARRAPGQHHRPRVLGRRAAGAGRPGTASPAGAAAAAFVKAHDSSDFEGTTERQFDHHLLHQVTYDTLLKAERKLGHGAAARWLAERTQGRGAEFLAMTGEHAERAGDTALAIDCFEQAGLRAQERFANASAVSWLRRALRLMGETEPMQRADLLHQLAQIGDVLGDRSTQAALHQEVTELLRLHPDDHRSARNLFSQALLADRLGDRAASEDLARRCFTLAEACGAMGVAAVVQAQLAWLQMSKQDYAGAAVHIETGLAWASRWADEQTRPVTEGQLLMLSGIVSSKLAQYAAARKAFMAVLARGEALGSLRLQLGASDFLAEVAGELGHWDEMSAWGERLGALAEAMGSPSGISASQQKRAEAAEGRGEFVEAIGLHEKSLPANQRIGNRVLEAHTFFRLAGPAPCAR